MLLKQPRKFNLESMFELRVCYGVVNWLNDASKSILVNWLNDGELHNKSYGEL